MNATPLHSSTDDMPLWRLLVLLDDAERLAGADSQTARTLARIVKERLRGNRDASAREEGGVRHAK